MAAFSRNAKPIHYEAELVAVGEVMAAGQYGHGDITERFERAVAEFLGAPDVVAVSSGTMALHIALTAAGIGPGDEVVVPSMTFCATVQAIVASGARPRFAEVDPATMCMGAAQVMDAITPATRAVVPVLYGGRAVPLDTIFQELSDRGVVVVEDAAHAFGSFHGGVRVGAAGAVTCFSFGPIKNLTCGQGGGIVPRNPEEAGRARRMRLVGMVERADQRANSTSYRVERPGVRGHMSQINAAIGLVQLPRFTTVEPQRKALWRSYAAALNDLAEVVLVDVDVEHSVPSLCAVRVPDRDRVFETMRKRRIGVGVHYPPNHLQPAFSSWYCALPVTEQVAEEVMTLPFHHDMTEQDVRVVVSALKETLR